MHTSRLWRDVVTEIGASEYPDVPARPRARRLVRDDDRRTRRRRSTSSSPRTRSATSSRTSPPPSPAGSVSRLLPRSGDDGPGLFEPVHGSAPADRRAGDREPGRDAALDRAPAPARARPRRRTRTRSSGRSTRRSSRPRPAISAARRRRVTWATPSCAGSADLYGIVSRPCRGATGLHRATSAFALFGFAFTALVGAPSPPRAG